QPARLEEFAKGLGGRGEAARHPDSGRRQLADHLAERCVLAADDLDVIHAELVERYDGLPLESGHVKVLKWKKTCCAKRSSRKRRDHPLPAATLCHAAAAGAPSAGRARRRIAPDCAILGPAAVAARLAGRPGVTDRTTDPPFRSP